MAMPTSPASPLFLREAEIRRGIELVTFGYAYLIRTMDERLAAAGLGRAHHRALYFIARRPGLTVGMLLQLTGVTKQSLGRVLNELTARALIEARVGRDDRRQRLLYTTAAGKALEAELFELLRARLSAAYVEAGPSAVASFWQVLEAIVPPSDRAMLAALRA